MFMGNPGKMNSGDGLRKTSRSVSSFATMAAPKRYLKVLRNDKRKKEVAMSSLLHTHTSTIINTHRHLRTRALKGMVSFFFVVIFARVHVRLSVTPLFPSCGDVRLCCHVSCGFFLPSQDRKSVV